MLNYREFTPSEQLREYLECYWTLETDISLKKELCLPDGSASLIFNFGPPYHRAVFPLPSKWEKIGNCSLPHQGKECVLITQEKPVRLLGVRFKPYGLSPFFNISMPDYPPPFVLHGEALSGFLGGLEEKLWAVSNFDERIELLEADFTARIPGLAPPDETVKTAVAEMMKREGNLKISDLLDLLCVSKSSLEKKFQEAVGLSPKILCNILRFNSIIYNQTQEPSPTLTELTYNQGFFDQSHLVHSFKSFTGVSPGKFFRQDNRLLELICLSFESRMSEIYGTVV